MFVTVSVGVVCVFVCLFVGVACQGNWMAAVFPSSFACMGMWMCMGTHAHMDVHVHAHVPVYADCTEAELKKHPRAMPEAGIIEPNRSEPILTNSNANPKCTKKATTSINTAFNMLVFLFEALCPCS
jgi:hypothetical protein